MGGGTSTLEFLRRFQELENKVAQLEAENKLLLSSNAALITEAPSGGKVKIFNVTKDISIASGKLPNYSKGMYIPNSNGNDAILIAVDIVGGNKLITAAKANNAWQSIKVI